MNRNYDFLAYGSPHSADFEEKTLTFKIQGDMPSIASGRFAIVSFDKFSSTVRQAGLWADSQKKEAA